MQTDPWSVSNAASTPFDQEFYLIMNVAVGGSNGWFKDDSDNKPWIDGSPNARTTFWNARDQWYPTWQGPKGAQNSATGTAYGEMRVRSVKMWQQKGWKGC